MFGTSFRQGADVDGVAEEFMEGDFGGDHARLRIGFDIADLAASSAEIADNVALILNGRGDFGRHDRFEQHGSGFPHGVFEGHARSRLEGELGRIDGMERTIDDATTHNVTRLSPRSQM